MKIKFIKTTGKRGNQKTGEKGQALLLVLVLLLVGVMIISASLAFAGTSLKTNQVYVKNTNDLYAAEAGIQDGTNNVLYQSDSGLNAIFSASLNASYGNPTYNDYDYSHSWTYQLPSQANPTIAATVNKDNVVVKIKNVWVPYGITAPSSTVASSIINNTYLTVTGGVYSIPNYTLNITYTGGAVSLPIISIGVWLPQGFTYNNNSSNLQGIYSTEQIVQCAGNQAVIWTFPGTTTYTSLLASLGQTGKSSITIQFTYQTALQQIPDALGWIVDGGNSLLPYTDTWNADIQDYDLIADAGNTEIESYIPKSATRNLGTAINGDYVSIGNSLMTMAPYTQSNDADGIRYTLLTHSSSTVAADSTKPNSTVVGAYLYWSGWLSRSSETMGSSYGEKVNFKVDGVQFAVSCSNPQTKANGATSNGDYSYSCYADVTSSVQGELQTEGHSIFNNLLTIDVGPATGCVLGDTGNEWSYAAWSLVLIYSNPTTFGHQLYLYDNFAYGASTGETSYPNVTNSHGSDIDPTGDTQGPGGVISGFIVPPQDPNTQDTNPSGTNSQGVNNYDPAATLTAFVGEGDWCYAGDFLAFNAPSTYWSNPWSIPDGNVSKLWDGVTLGTSQLAASPYLPNTAAQPDNVWNGDPQNGTSSEGGISYTLPQYEPSAQDGVDIKTFVILWESGLLQPGATTARIDMPTYTDSWNLVYLILSFRSSVTSGGAISYLIRHR